MTTGLEGSATRAARLLNILLVEDDPMDAEAFLRAAREAGLPHRITLATNGEDALDHLGRRDVRVELVVMDLKMPRMGGLELLEALKASRGGVRRRRSCSRLRARRTIAWRHINAAPRGSS